MCHHTASNPGSNGAQDVDYIINRAPWGGVICNLYLDRSGTWWVIAAGRAATNGGGHDFWGGGVPDDMMNHYAIGIEAANNGIGEAWPAVQTTSYVNGVAGLCKAYSITPSRVRAHSEWSKGRKIDPAGPSPWATGKNMWNMDSFRSSVAKALAGMGTVTPPVPKPPATTNAVQAPHPTLRKFTSNDVAEVKKFQQQCNFWGWHDAAGRTLPVDGDYGNRSAEACVNMQVTLKQYVDGVYGPQTAAAFQSFLNAMTLLAK
jgi:hypothetical protein